MWKKGVIHGLTDTDEDVERFEAKIVCFRT